jgi:hypothetical protein
LSVHPTLRPEGPDGDDDALEVLDEPTARDPFSVLAGIGVGCAALVVAGLVTFLPSDGLPSAFRTSGPAAEDTAGEAPLGQPRRTAAPGSASAAPGEAPGGSAEGSAVPGTVLLSEAAGTRLLPVGRPQRLLDSLEGGPSPAAPPQAGSGASGGSGTSSSATPPAGSASDGSAPVTGEAPAPPVDEPPAPPAPGSPVVGSPVDEPPLEEPPVPEPPVDEPPVDESPVVGSPVEESPVVGSPVDEPPAEEPPPAEVPAGEDLAPTAP